MLPVFLAVLDNEEQKSEFEILYNRYEKLVYTVAFSRLHRRTLTEDCTQDVFLDAALQFDTIRMLSPPQQKNISVGWPITAPLRFFIKSEGIMLLSIVMNS